MKRKKKYLHWKGKLAFQMQRYLKNVNVLLRKQKPKNRISYTEYAYRFVWRLEKLYSGSYYYIRQTYIHISVYIHYIGMGDIVKYVTLIWALNKIQLTKHDRFLYRKLLATARKTSWQAVQVYMSTRQWKKLHIKRF